MYYDLRLQKINLEVLLTLEKYVRSNSVHSLATRVYVIIQNNIRKPSVLFITYIKESVIAFSSRYTKTIQYSSMHIRGQRENWAKGTYNNIFDVVLTALLR